MEETNDIIKQIEKDMTIGEQMALRTAQVNQYFVEFVKGFIDNLRKTSLTDDDIKEILSVDNESYNLLCNKEFIGTVSSLLISRIILLCSSTSFMENDVFTDSYMTRDEVAEFIESCRIGLRLKKLYDLLKEHYMTSVKDIDEMLEWLEAGKNANADKENEEDEENNDEIKNIVDILTDGNNDKTDQN